MADQPAALTEDSYQELLGLLKSDDPGSRTLGQSLAKKLTPDEQQAFFAFQQKANTGRNEATRQDVSVGGVPPELAAVAGAGGVAAAGESGLSAAQRLYAGLKSLTANPVIRYQLVKGGLETAGVPSSIAIPIGYAVSGRGGVAAPVAATSTDAAATTADPGVAATVAKPAIRAIDYLRIKRLVEQGVPMPQATQTVLQPK